MDNLAIYASTVYEAARLLEVLPPYSIETTRVAASVAGQALEFASEDGRRWVEAELRRHNQLGAENDQFPQKPWVLWEQQRIFTLLQTADFPSIDKIAEIPASRLVAMGPVAILAAMGAPHRRLRIPPTFTAGLVGTLVGLGAVFMLRRGAS